MREKPEVLILGIGGEKGDRTLDLRLMSPALYQLSYLAKAPIQETTSAYDTKFYPLPSTANFDGIAAGASPFCGGRKYGIIYT